jgi:hypothetical protein
LCPRDGEIDDRPALVNRLNSFEGSENHLSLDTGTERRTKVMAIGQGTKTTRGALMAAVTSLATVIETVGIPRSSIFL